MKMPDQTDGRIRALPDISAITMSFLEGFECPECHNPVISSSAYVLCPCCGVYWNYTRIEEAKHE